MYICVAFSCQAVISCISLEAMHFCCRKAKNSCFSPKTLIYGIFVANVAKTQHTRFEDNILRKFANEDKPPVVQACQMLRDVLRCSNMVQNAQTWSKVLWDGPWYSDMVHATEPWPWAVQVSEVRCGARDAASERVRPVYRAGQTPPQLNTVTLTWHPFPELEEKNLILTGRLL